MDTDNNTRQWAQLFVVSADHRLLLIHHPNASAPWRPAGGELCLEEGFGEAARRALEASTGLAGPLGPLLHECEVPGEQSPGQWRERYFLVRHDPASQTRREMPGRWWSLDELRQAPAGQLKPAWLPELLERVIAGDGHALASAARL